MAKSAKPTFIPEWARNDTTDPVLGTANVVEPSEAKKDSGWDPYEKPPRNWMNWLQRGAHLWIDYFNQFFTATHQFKIDEILEETSAAGVTIDGVVCKDGNVTASGTVITNTIAELGTASGVTIDGVLCKDSVVTANVTGNVTGDVTGDITGHSHAVQAGGTASGVMRWTILNIGDWNMDSTASVDVAHGLTFSKIRTCSAMIISDGGTLVLFNQDTTGSISLQSGTNVALTRTGSGIFDSPNYDTTSFNRGYVTIGYID